EATSNIPREMAARLLDNAWIKKDAAGKPIASREMLVQLRLPERNGMQGVVSVRGVEPGSTTLRPGIRLLEGRMFQPGLPELIVGRALLNRFPGLLLGGRVRIESNVWKIVGSFASGGDAHESEVLGDAESLLSATHRNGFQSVTAALESPEILIRFNASLAIDPSLSVDAQREDIFYAARSQTIIRVLTIIGITVGAIMAAGAIFAALNTMVAAVAAEAGLIATLRA